MSDNKGVKTKVFLKELAEHRRKLIALRAKYLKLPLTTETKNTMNTINKTLVILEKMQK